MDIPNAAARKRTVHRSMGVCFHRGATHYNAPRLGPETQVPRRGKVGKVGPGEARGFSR